MPIDLVAGIKDVCNNISNCLIMYINTTPCAAADLARLDKIADDGWSNSQKCVTVLFWRLLPAAYNL